MYIYLPVELLTSKQSKMRTHGSWGRVPCSCRHTECSSFSWVYEPLDLKVIPIVIPCEGLGMKAINKPNECHIIQYGEPNVT